MSPLLISTVLFLTIFLYSLKGPTPSSIPLINPKSSFDVLGVAAKRDYAINGGRVIEAGFKKFGKTKPFRVISDAGEMIILPSSMAHDIRNDERLSFAHFISKYNHQGIPGFESMSDSALDHRLVKMIQNKLTPSLSKVTEALSDEVNIVVRKLFTDNKEKVLDLVAQVSARAFLGEELCRNPDWLRITKEFSVFGFIAGMKLRMVPQHLRRLAHWFLPSCRQLRTLREEAIALIKPVVENRRLKKAVAGSAPQFDDALEWFEQVFDGDEYNAASFQLALSTAAVHSTADLLTQVLFDLIENPDLVDDLRKEIVSVIGDTGWKKTAIFKLRLMDSVLKESQRLKPAITMTMCREVLSEYQLSDGTLLPKGALIGISTNGLWDEENWENAGQFDGYRFLRMREKFGGENHWQLATPTKEHLAFGYGKHACPGRLFATQELKIILCHLLLKYDLKMASGEKARVQQSGILLNADGNAKIVIRRRLEQYDLRSRI
ncbi:cytochrome P450 [Colletotrichum somersetense]|nr:cytochrome P450 [Colletotrichum somersetense]